MKNKTVAPLITGRVKDHKENIKGRVIASRMIASNSIVDSFEIEGREVLGGKHDNSGVIIGFEDGSTYRLTLGVIGEQDSFTPLPDTDSTLMTSSYCSGKFIAATMAYYVTSMDGQDTDKGLVTLWYNVELGEGTHSGILGEWEVSTEYVPESLRFKAVLYEPPEIDIEKEPGCICQSCSKHYKTDVLVPNDLWEEIKPEGKAEGAGLLCGSCILDRIEKRHGFSTFELKAV